MRCICVQACTIRIGKRSVFFSPGSIYDFEECPSCFQELKDRVIDFKTASEVELLESENWTVESALQYIAASGGPRPTGELTRGQLVSLIIDARERRLPAHIAPTPGLHEDGSPVLPITQHELAKDELAAEIGQIMSEQADVIDAENKEYRKKVESKLKADVKPPKV